MRAVLLCPGPSLSALDAVPDCDVVAAVNRAALLQFGVDWFCALDYPTIRDNRERVTAPNLLSRRQTIADLGDRLNQFKRVVAIEDIHPPGKADTFTATAALVLLAHEDAKVIDVYGADWRGSHDYDGTEAGENRTDARWAREAFLWGQTVDWLRDKGVEVRRHIAVTV